MHQNFTKLKPSFFRTGLVLMFALLFAFSNTMGQTYTNGNLATGDTALNGTVAPAGYTFSQIQTQVGGNALGIPAGIPNEVSIADDFIIPAGQAWTISNMIFYAYSTGYMGTTSPFNQIRIKIFNSDPSIGAPTPIFGDTSTNRFASSADAHIYRIANTVDFTRKIWSITANTPVQLGPGHYWIEFQIANSNSSANWMPPSTLRGALTAPGYNAYQHAPITDNSPTSWIPMVDGTARLDMPFKINYTSCVAPTITISSTGNCAPSTLTASGATTYTWSPSTGLNTTTGATVIANPVSGTTYTVSGTSGGCVGTASIQITDPFTSAVLTGVDPTDVHINESFNDSLPPGWLSINNSDIPGALNAWSQGFPGAFDSHTGDPSAYIFANYQMSDGDVLSAWMLTSEVPIKNGDKISFWTRTTRGVYPDRLELRMSTAGASSDVGVTPTSVGDFTTLLLTVNPDLETGDAYPSVWTKYEATISGITGTVTGRFGFRYYVTDLANNGEFIGIDDVVFETPLTCTPAGSAQNISVNVTGGAGPYTVVYSNGTNNITVPNYTNGALIPVTPNGTTTYSLVSVVSSGGCAGTNVSGSYTFTGGATITTQPDTLTTVCGSGPATIRVVADGSGNTYQWQVSTDGGATFANVADGANYSGATTATLTLSNITGAMTGYIYHVNITGGSCPGVTTSANSTLSVAATTVITTQPASATSCAGQTATFSVQSNGVTYQWQVSTDGGATFTDIAQANSSSLTIDATAGMDNYQYQVVIGNGCGINTTSTPATLTVSGGTVITTQPSATTSVCGSATAVISVVATGTENTYQWQVSTDGGTTFTNIADGANYSGTTSATLSILNPTENMSGYIYHVNITSGCGLVTSGNSTLSVAASTTITGQPANVSACENTTATYTVVSNGTTFQWQVSTDGGATFSDIPGATSATYVTAPVTFAMHGNFYRVIVGGCAASVTSTNGGLKVRNPATINTQPAPTSVCDGQNATFSVMAVADSLNYQWQVSTDGGTTFTNIPQANSRTLSVNATIANNNYQYQVVIGNGCGNFLTSNPATLTVTAATVITAQPQDVAICAGSDATFTVTATGNNLSYQWSSVSGTDSTTIAGANSASYTVTGANAGLNGTMYYVTVTSTCGNLNSSGATLTVNSPTTITIDDQTGCEGTDVTFSANGGGTGTTFQWQVSTDGGTTWNNIPGETSPVLVLIAVTVEQGGSQYRVVGTGACGSSNSNAGTLNVIPLPMVDIDGPEAAVCEGSSITLTGTGAETYVFDNNVTSGVAFTISNTTTYTVTGTASGCSSTATFTVTVNPSPVVTLSTTATALNEGDSATITATSTPGSTTYTWYKDGVEITGSTGNSIVVTYNNPGVYTASVNVDECSGTSNEITITAIPVNNFYSFITPNPNNGLFKVNYKNTGNTTSTRVISIFDSKGSLVYMKTFTVVSSDPIQVMDVDATILSSGAYHLLLSDGNAKRLKTATFIKQ